MPMQLVLMSRKQRNQQSNVGKIAPIEVPVLQDKKPTPTPFKTVGTCRKSKSGNAISIKLFEDNRFLHISLKDAEAIITDETNSVIGNVREYERLENIGGN
jgi:hypothetical protein